MINTNKTTPITNTEDANMPSYDIKVTRAKIVKDEVTKQTIIFDFTCNGVLIKDNWFLSGTSKDGKPYEFVKLPGRDFQNQDGKMVTRCYVSIEHFNDYVPSIIAQITKLLTE